MMGVLFGRAFFMVCVAHRRVVGVLSLAVMIIRRMMCVVKLLRMVSMLDSRTIRKMHVMLRGHLSVMSVMLGRTLIMVRVRHH